jgi:hypothetical protein
LHVPSEVESAIGVSSVGLHLREVQECDAKLYVSVVR